MNSKHSLEEFQQSIIDSFRTNEALKSYTRAAENGLWESEGVMIAKYFKNGGRILDVGCGTGRTTRPLHHIGYRVTGLDIVPEMIETARKISAKTSLDIDYRIGDVAALEFENDVFDGVLFSFNGWAQIPTTHKRTRALLEISRVLKPGGHFIFTIPIFYFWKNPGILFRQITRNFIFKPLGFSPVYLEWRDIFFSRETPTQFVKNQYIHMATVSETTKFLLNASFDIVEIQKRSQISRSDDTLGLTDCMFYVVKK